jgi:predicted enzyme related to lactoylglutathione lyase
MIQKLSHVSVPVLDQEEAREFYVEKLGFEVRTDQTMGDFRWLTVGPKGQPDLEMILMKVGATPMMDEQKAAMLRQLVESGSIGCGVLETDDCQATYERLQAAGVEFLRPPEKRPYGIEALLKDSSGNWFSMVQRY